MLRRLSVAGNSPVGIKDLRDGHSQMLKYSRRDVLLLQLLLSSSSSKINIFSQQRISNHFRVGGSWPIAKCVSKSHLQIPICTTHVLLYIIACIFSQLEIISFLRLLGSNPPSGKETRAEQLRISIFSRCLGVCMPMGKDLRFLQLNISMYSRFEL